MRARSDAPQTQGTFTRHYPPGQAASAEDFEPGDFVLTHSNSFRGWLIRIGQQLRFWGANKKYAWWSHAALIVSRDGDLVEAVGAGVQLTNIARYSGTDYHIVHLGSLATNTDREQVVAFGKWALGLRYGSLTNLSIAISLLTGSRFTFFFDGQFICSGLVARALERTSAIFDRSPSHIVPADLARYFAVQRPPKGSKRGAIPPVPPTRSFRAATPGAQPH